jgi:alpha-tubulin suppressor-like RCC1 family protein
MTGCTRVDPAPGVVFHVLALMLTLVLVLATGCGRRFLGVVPGDGAAEHPGTGGAGVGTGGAMGTGGAVGTGGAIGTGGAAGAAPDPDRVVEVVVGTVSTCARSAAGKVRCFGTGVSGALGYGNAETIGDDELPYTAGDLPLRKRAIQLAAGGRHGCALLEGGTVTCWGLNNSGELGYGHSGSVGIDVPAGAEEVPIDPADPVRQIATGYRHTCALLESGRVYCWGSNGVNQLGYPNVANVGDNETPQVMGPVDVGGRVLQISAGHSHTCALMDEGMLRCWGSNVDGQLGYGRSEVPLPPSATEAVPVGAPVARVSAGLVHTCALLLDRSVRCWGNGGMGRLGYGNTDTVGDNEPASAAPPPITFPGGAIDVRAGGLHSCALYGAGAVTCWGYYIMLGNGGGPDVGDDERVSSDSYFVLLGAAGAAISAGHNHTCALTVAGGVRCWGRGRETPLDPIAGGEGGWLGYGDVMDVSAPRGDVRIFE